MSGYFKILHIGTILTVLLVLQQTTSTQLTDVLLPDLTLVPVAPIIRIPRDTNYSREKYPRYINDNSDKTLKPEDSTDRDTAATPLGKRCISCVSSVLNRYPTYDTQTNDRNRYYDDYRTRDYDRYDDRDKYYDRDRYNDRDRSYDRYDRYSPDRDRNYRGRDRYYEPYEYDRGYEPYDRERYDRYGYGRDRTWYDPNERNDRYSDRGVGYDNRGYDYRGYDNRYDTYPYRSYDDAYRGYSPGGSGGGGRDYGTSGYASKWNYGNSGGGRDDYNNRDRYSGYRSVNKDPVRDPARDPTRDPVRDPYNDTYRPTSYLYGRPSSTTIKPPSPDDSNTQAPQESSG